MGATFHTTPTRALSDYTKNATLQLLLEFGNCLQNEANSWPKQPVVPPESADPLQHMAARDMIFPV
eukprot:2362656-Pleurochrysis_carterae.AAC.1